MINNYSAYLLSCVLLKTLTVNVIPAFFFLNFFEERITSGILNRKLA